MLFLCSSSTIVFSLVLLFFSTGSVHGWGSDGHAFIAAIAQSRLTDASSTFVRDHLPANIKGNMSNVSSWADNILYPDTDPDYWNWQWSKLLHYADTKDWSCVYDRQNDCNWTTGQRCVDGAIQNYTERLADAKLDATQRQEALKFLIHFIGDAHQPLHAGFKGDRGGNEIRGRFFSKETNLHSLWDTGMIEYRISQDFRSQPPLYLDYLLKQMNNRYAQNISDWTQCSSSDESHYLACSTLWIEEDAKVNCKLVYRDEDDQPLSPSKTFNFGKTYYNTRMDTLELRLIQAGVRLAAVINKIVQSEIKEKKPEKTYSITMLLLMILVIQSTLIILLLICSLFRRRRTIVIQMPMTGEKGEHLISA